MMDNLTHAKLYATMMHVDRNGQKYGVLPYTHHLGEVEAVLRRFGPIPPPMDGHKHSPGDRVMDRQSGRFGIVSTVQEPNMPWHEGGTPHVVTLATGTSLGWWHDCAPWSPEDPSVEEMVVAAWLHDVVEDTEAKTRDIEELFGERVCHLVSAVTSEEGPNRKTRNALTYPKIRTAGRYAVRLKLADRVANMESGGSSLGMYKREFPDFRHWLYTAGENEDLWRHLDNIVKR